MLPQSRVDLGRVSVHILVEDFVRVPLPPRVEFPCSPSCALVSWARILAEHSVKMKGFSDFGSLEGSVSGPETFGADLTLR
jgi:hypothetical protein